MAEPLNSASFVTVGIENTAGTPVKGQVELDFTSETLEGKGEPIRRRSINRRRSAKGAVQGPYRADGDISVELTPDKWTKVLYAGLTDLVTSGTTDPYTHVFKVGTTLKPLTIQILRDDTYFLYPGQYVQRINIRAVIDDILNAAFTFAGKGKEVLYDAEKSDVAIAASALDPFVFFQGSVSLLGDVTGSPNTDTNNWAVDINTGLITPKSIGAGRAPNRAHPGDSIVSGSFDMVFDSITQHRKWMGATADTYPINVGTTLNYVALQLLFTASATRTMQIDIPKAYYKASGPHVTGRDGIIMQPLTFDSIYDTVMGTDIKITIKNQEANADITTAGTNV